jgi:hypothetical protein
MKRAWIVLASLAWACGPSYGGQDVKTPDELIAEQEKLAEEDEKKRQSRGDNAYTDEATDEEKRKEFDKRQAKLELQRATRSAESCPGVVAAMENKENKQRGEATVTITFQEDGSVKSAAIGSPFTDTPVGNCAANAFKSVIVPPYTGGDQIVDWKIQLVDQKEEKKAAETKK